MRTLIDEIEISKLLKKEGTKESLGRWENVMELLSAISDYSKQSDNGGLDGFLERVSLFTDIDGWDNRQEAVTLMTVHNAKGLEFSIVFISGLEDGLFPLYNYMKNRDEIEEERRLFYVGATRAIDKLYLSYSSKRMRFGEIKKSECSRFLNEIDKNFLDMDLVSTSTKDYRSKKSYEIYAGTEKYKIGEAVLHEMFGNGRIVEIEGRGEFMKVLVDFEVVGEKKLLLKYANLKVMN